MHAPDVGRTFVLLVPAALASPPDGEGGSATEGCCVFARARHVPADILCPAALLLLLIAGESRSVAAVAHADEARGRPSRKPSFRRRLTAS
jgi:hypothetical protein